MDNYRNLANTVVNWVVGPHWWELNLHPLSNCIGSVHLRHVDASPGRGLNRLFGKFNSTFHSNTVWYHRAMQQALADFRIESDRVVFLAFTDGRSYRVSPNDLERFLGQDDLQRVRRALRLRQQFLRRILPPTAVILVVVGIIGFGRYDMDRVSHGWPAPQSPASQQQVSTTNPAPASTPASPSTAAGTPTSQANPPTARGNQKSAAASSNQRSGLSSQHAVSKLDSESSANPAPAASPDGGVQRVLAPVTTPVGGAVKRLSKLLP